ncbi:radical SAM protein [Butyrivibrio sp. AE3004]|uniref:radical SAM protein n=1 Tax=Butyrivibrio sp. AE3004 TaxID=1506994 RepID=UPI000493FB76|nr:radical SAM protein [Butyrivibrio sp. AE3004]
MRKNYIIGVGKRQKDFEYVFNDIAIDGYINEEEVSLDGLTPENAFVYICSSDILMAKKVLQSSGFIEYKDFIEVTELFKSLDFDLKRVSSNKTIIIWGKGFGFRDLLSHCPNVLDSVGAIIDNAATDGEVISGIPVYKANDFPFNDGCFFIVTVREQFRDVERELLKRGIKRENFVFYDRLILKPSELLLKTYLDKQYQEDVPICSAAFEFFQIHENGNMGFCCPSWNSSYSGNLYWDHFDEAYYSIFSRIFWLSVINRTYTFCNWEQCPMLQNFSKICKCDERDVKNPEYCIKPSMPKVLAINIDKRCNLYCASCRNAIYIPSDREIDNTKQLVEIVKKEVLINDIKKLLYAGNGEVFLCDTYRELIKSGKSKQSLMLLSNGNLFTLQKFEEYTKGYEKVGISISIDAASKSTYEKVRRGGNWERLIRNLEEIGKLRKRNVIETFHINFVISAVNVHEVKAVIALAKKLGADCVNFTRLVNWGTYTDKEFDDYSIVDEKGLLKDKFKEYLSGPEIGDSVANFCNLVCVTKEFGGDAILAISDYKIKDLGICE